MMTTDTVGGVWTFTRELVRELLSRGHEVCLVSFGRLPSVEQRECMNDLLQRFAPSFAYEASTAPLEWMQNNAAAREPAVALLRLSDIWRPAAYLFSQFCFAALPLAGAKIVIAHSDVLSWAAACDETLDGQSEWMKTYLTLVQGGLSGADAVVAPTHAYLADLRSHFSDLPPVCGVIANGRGIPAAPAPMRELRAVTAGRMWDKAKNLQLLRDVSSTLPLVVAGECDDLIADSGGGLQWVGMQTEAGLLQIFRTSAVYLCTSLYEPFGLAPLEAAQCGCALVAMDIPSLREVWDDGALYFNDPVSLTSTLNLLRDDEDLLHAAQQRSTRRAALFTASRMADQYLALISALTSDAKVSTHAA